MFELYSDLGDVEHLKAAPEVDEAMVSKPRARKNGQETGGCAFLNGALFAIVSNRNDRCAIRHEGGIHDARHEALNVASVRDAVQSLGTAVDSERADSDSEIHQPLWSLISEVEG